VSLLHPEVRIPTWVAVAVVAAAYVVRAVLMRGGDFRLDLPADLIVAVLLAILLGVREILHRAGWDRPGRSDAPTSPGQDDPDS